MQSGGNSAMAREVEHRGYQAAAKVQRGESLKPETQQAAHSHVQQSHQQTEQSKDTRTYAQGQEKMSLLALKQDAQTKDSQRLQKGHTQEQSKQQDQQQQKGQEKSNEQQKQQGR